MRNGRGKKIVCLAAAILWLLFIWSNSLQTADESSQISSGVVAWLMPLLAQTGLPEEIWHTLIRKLAHMAEFTVAGLLWSAALSPGTETAPCVRWKRRGVALLACLAIAVADETIQRFIPGRSGELRDVCIDLLGAMLGVLAAMALEMILANKRRKT